MMVVSPVVRFLDEVVSIEYSIFVLMLTLKLIIAIDFQWHILSGLF